MGTWLTIVTAVRDDPVGLDATIDSLRRCDLAGVEVLVVDSSRDARYAEALSSGVARVRWTEPQGIYAAMNVGLEDALGDYVYFLNAGDTLYSPQVLASLRELLLLRPAWLFGRVEIIEVSERHVVTPTWDYAREKSALFARGLFPPHQGTIVNTSLLRSLGGFDTSYRIAADYAAFLRLSQAADPTVLDLVLATFSEGGASTLGWQESFREFHRARVSILRPRGVLAVRERISTVWHFAKVFAYREFWARIARR